ncbi:AraC family transcriptional regulator [uncultured Aquimarina sp.]|uniref:helix-turn-helix domain-containing protein n=1 Tax=uncultured Aquimarina sp. TaxID=575652 RepID=UPI00260CE1EA|nr:AraC family transcriptional regulator [uncultured Aquimarina sp.]
MSNDFILQIITAILCFVSILFAIFLLFVESKNKLGNRILALFLIVRAIDASVIIYINYIAVHPALDVFRHDAGGFLQLPLLFLFVLSIIYRDFRLKRKYLLLLIPFLLSTLVAIPRYYLEYLGFRNSLFDGLPLSFEISFTYSLNFIQNLSLIVLTFVILKRYKRIMMENFSKTDNDNHRWLLQMNVISSFLFFAALIKNVHKYQENPQFIMQLRILVMTISLLFICWLVFKALMAPKLFRGIDSSLQLVNVNDGPKLFEETNESKLTLQKIEKLKTYMDHKEPYLNPELTIAELATELDINVTELSTLINHHLSQNFHLFVNQYRIHKAKELLSDVSNNYNIQEILYKVGFNSKSSFNVSFKSLTGLTPSQYKNKTL